MIGTWTASGTQLTGHAWSLRLTIQPQEGGGYSYKIDYFPEPCSGYWTVQSVSPDLVTFTEHIVYGHERCLDLGHWTVSPLPDGSGKITHMAGRWEGLQPDGRHDEAEGVLTREPSPAP